MHDPPIVQKLQEQSMYRGIWGVTMISEVKVSVGILSTFLFTGYSCDRSLFIFWLLSTLL